jgi:hypothetical protein
LLALLLAATLTAPHVGLACADTPAPLLCAIKEQHHRVNTWRIRYGDGRSPLSRDVLLYPHRRPYYLWREVARRDAAHARYVRLWGWIAQPAHWCVHVHESADWHYIGTYDGGYQYLVSTWLRAGGGRFASRAGYATPEQQARVTRAYTQRYGWGEWGTAAACGL